MSRGARSILRALRDGTLVIASILIAFGLEAWWADRGLQRDLSADLASVREQLRSVRLTVESQSRRSQRIMDVGNRLLERLASERASGVVTVPDTVVFWAVSATPTMNVSIGAVDALIASGRFGAIRHAELRTALANLDARVASVTENQVTARDYSLSVLSPRLDEVLDRLSTARLRSLPAFPFIGRPSETLGNVQLPNNQAVRNGLDVRVGYFIRSVGAMGSLIEDIDHILSLLDEELSGGVADVNRAPDG
jgi:hypothetical protein